MLTTRPFERIFAGTGVSPETARRFIESVTHYHLENDLVVSVMDRSQMLAIEGIGFEVMAFRDTEWWGPAYFGTERECLMLRDRIAEVPISIKVQEIFAEAMREK